MPREPEKRIPANLITGFLGVGKTTALRDLLGKRPAGERWAIVVNEYGAVSLDHVLLEDPASDDVIVREVAGGCFCCTTSLPLQAILVPSILRTRPDRLLIEPTGAGHPARVIDLLRGEGLGSAIDLRATICLIDPRDFDNPAVCNQEVFRDQVQMADVAVLNRVDQCSPDRTERCRRWIEGQYPPKLLTATTTFGRLEPAWLDLAAGPPRAPLFADLHAGHDREPRHEAVAIETPATAGRPRRFEQAAQGRFACGWIFSPADTFDRERLFALLEGLPNMERVKGVFHCPDDWWFVNRVGPQTSCERSAYRRDSRLEIIAREPLDGPLLESRLQACLVGALTANWQASLAAEGARFVD